MFIIALTFVYPHSIPIWAVHIGVGLNDPCVLLPTHDIL